MDGWIKLHRQITEHWIWQDPIKFRWWIDMLLMANHSDVKVNIGFELYECKRGQSILSLKSWGERWGVSKDTVRNFFVLLSKDNMILSENLQKSTRITICNYDTYQGDLHTKQTQSKREANAKQTQAHPNNNDKKEKEQNNDKKEISDTEILAFEEFRIIYPGTKRGLQTEFDNFKKKHTDWEEVVAFLKPSIQREIAFHQNAKKNALFVPGFANLSTWINQRRWESEFDGLSNTESVKNTFIA